MYLAEFLRKSAFNYGAAKIEIFLKSKEVCN